MEKQGSDANANTLEDAAICQTIEEVVPKPERTRQEDAGDKAATKLDIIYSIEDTPPWYLCLMLGFQVNSMLVTKACIFVNKIYL